MCYQVKPTLLCLIGSCPVRNVVFKLKLEPCIFLVSDVELCTYNNNYCVKCLSDLRAKTTEVHCSSNNCLVSHQRKNDLRCSNGHGAH